MNSVNLIGRTVKDIEVTVAKDESWCCTRFSLAIPDGKDKTQFINCVAWNEQAELLEQYVKKGNIVAVEGRLTQNNYTDKEGIKHYATEVTVSRVELLPNPEKKAEEAPQEAPEQPQTKKYHRNK